MSTQSLPVDTQLIIQTWNYIAIASGFKAGSLPPTKHELVLTGWEKWISKNRPTGKANVHIEFLVRPYQMFLKKISVEFIPDNPIGSRDMLKGETLMAFYHQRLVPDFMPENRPYPFVVTCPQNLVILLARHNFVSSIGNYPEMFTSLNEKTIAE